MVGFPVKEGSDLVVMRNPKSVLSQIEKIARNEQDAVKVVAEIKNLLNIGE